MAFLFGIQKIRLSDKAKWMIFGFILVYVTLMVGCMISLNSYAFDDKNEGHRMVNGDVTAGSGQDKDTEDLSEGDLLPAGTSPAQSGAYPIQIDKGYEKDCYDNFRFLFGSDQIEDIRGALDFSFGGQKVAVTDSIEAIYNSLAWIGTGLVVIFMCADILEKMTRDMIDGETVIRTFIKFVIIKAAIDGGVPILKGIFDVGSSLTASLADGGSTSIDNFLWSLADFIQDSGMLYCYVILFCSFIPYLIAWLLSLVILATAYGRIITIIVRGGFAPIACASMIQDGFSGNGMRYLKKFFGCVIQGAVILAIVIAGKTVMGFVVGNVIGGGINSLTSLGDFIGATLSCMVVLFTEVLLVLKSEQTAMDIAGA